jgi:hypothetical protein
MPSNSALESASGPSESSRSRGLSSGGKEYVKLHLKEVKRGAERTRYACKTKVFRARV